MCHICSRCLLLPLRLQASEPPLFLVVEGRELPLGLLPPVGRNQSVPQLRGGAQPDPPLPYLVRKSGSHPGHGTNTSTCGAPGAVLGITYLPLF